MSWLANYITYTHKQESPTKFHMWSGMVAIAATLNRKIWLDRRSEGVTWYKIYPGQLMVVLVSPPARGHKTTAINFATSLMEVAGVKCIDAKVSMEKLIVELSNNGQPTQSGSKVSTKPPDAIATIVASELSNFLSKAVYSDSIVDFLIKIYDADKDFNYMTLKHSTITLHNPCITLFAGATPISIGESLPESAHHSGYTSRVLHVYHSGVEKEPDPLTDLDDSAVDLGLIMKNQMLLEGLKLDLCEIAKLQGPVSFTPSGKLWFDSWYKAWKKSPLSEGEGYVGRKHDHLLRLAMILRVSEDMKLELDDASLDAAMLLLDVNERDSHLAFTYIGNSSLAKRHEKIMEIIKSTPLGRIESSALFHRVRRYFDDLNQIRAALAVLEQSKEIKCDGVINGIEWWSLP